MSSFNALFTSSSARGAWLLQPGQALTLQCAAAGRMRVAGGTLWLTFDGPHPGPANARGDHVLHAGELVQLGAGERAVVEPAGTGAAASIEWEPSPPDPGAPPGPWARILRRGTDRLGSGVAAAVLRGLLALLACSLTAGLWLGAVAESRGHRADVLAAVRPAVAPG